MFPDPDPMSRRSTLFTAVAQLPAGRLPRPRRPCLLLLHGDNIIIRGSTPHSIVPVVRPPSSPRLVARAGHWSLCPALLRSPFSLAGAPVRSPLPCRLRHVSQVIPRTRLHPLGVFSYLYPGVPIPPPESRVYG